MTNKSSGLAVFGFVMAVVVFIAQQPARAGEYHTAAAGLICSDCHSMHASSKGQPSQPAAYLLKRADEVSLCLSCHDGTDVNAPDIISSGSSASPSSDVTTDYQSKYGSSAGIFQGDYLSAHSNTGHSLTGPAVAPLSSTYSKPAGLVCSDCHDPHGTGNYRNLISDPNPAHNGSFPITIGTNVKEATAVNVVSPDPAAAYNTENVSFSTSNNFKGWCTDCHDQLARNAQGISPAHFSNHPSDIAIGGNQAHTDPSNWLSGTIAEATGFGIDVGDGTAGIPRVRFGSPTVSNIPSQGDTVFCLSCHKAHGSSYHAGLVWPYQTNTPDSLSACQQCHYK